MKELGKEFRKRNGTKMSRQILLHAEQKETKEVTESSAEDIIRKALAKKNFDRDER